MQGAGLPVSKVRSQNLSWPLLHFVGVTGVFLFLKAQNQDELAPGRISDLEGQQDSLPSAAQSRLRAGMLRGKLSQDSGGATRPVVGRRAQPVRSAFC